MQLAHNTALNGENDYPQRVTSKRLSLMYIAALFIELTNFLLKSLVLKASL